MGIIGFFGYLLLRRSRTKQEDVDFTPSPVGFLSTASGPGPTLPFAQGGTQYLQDPFVTPPAQTGSGVSSTAQQPQMGYFGNPSMPVTTPAPGERPQTTYYDNYAGGSQLAYMQTPEVGHQAQHGVTGIWEQPQPYPVSQYSGPYQSDVHSTGTGPSTNIGPSQSLLSSAQRTTGVYSGHAEV